MLLHTNSVVINFPPPSSFFLLLLAEGRRGSIAAFFLKIADCKNHRRRLQNHAPPPPPPPPPLWHCWRLGLRSSQFLLPPSFSNFLHGPLFISRHKAPVATLGLYLISLNQQIPASWSLLQRQLINLQLTNWSQASSWINETHITSLEKFNTTAWRRSTTNLQGNTITLPPPNITLGAGAFWFCSLPNYI